MYLSERDDSSLQAFRLSAQIKQFLSLTNLTININGPNERQNTDTTTVPSIIILLNENVLQENLPSENIRK